MGKSAQKPAQIACQRANINAFAALDFEPHMRLIEHIEQGDGVNLHLARWQIDFFTGPRQLISALAVFANGRKLRRHLLNQAGEMAQGRFYGGGIGAHIVRRHDLAFLIIGRGLAAKSHHHLIAFAGVLHIGNGFGRLAQGNRQYAAGQRVERAGVTGFLRVKQAADFADGLRRAHFQRLVKIDPARQGAAFFATHFGFGH